MPWISSGAKSRESEEKAPPSKTEGRAPKFILGFVVRATRPRALILIMFGRPSM